MKNLVVYKSVSGFTRKYAEWLASELSADIVTLEEMNYKDLQAYKFLVYGGSLHAVGINGFKRFKKHIPELLKQGAKLAVFCTGASPVREGILDEVRAGNFLNGEHADVPLFYLRGGFDFSKLDTPNKIIMSILKGVLKRKKNPSPDEKGMLAAYTQAVDFCKKENLAEILAYAEACGIYQRQGKS